MRHQLKIFSNIKIVSKYNGMSKYTKQLVHFEQNMIS